MKNKRSSDDDVPAAGKGEGLLIWKEKSSIDRKEGSQIVSGRHGLEVNMGHARGPNNAMLRPKGINSSTVEEETRRRRSCLNPPALSAERTDYVLDNKPPFLVFGHVPERLDMCVSIDLKLRGHVPHHRDEVWRNLSTNREIALFTGDVHKLPASSDFSFRSNNSDWISTTGLESEGLVELAESRKRHNSLRSAGLEDVKKAISGSRMSKPNELRMDDIGASLSVFPKATHQATGALRHTHVHHLSSMVHSNIPGQKLGFVRREKQARLERILGLLSCPSEICLRDNPFWIRATLRSSRTCFIFGQDKGNNEAVVLQMTKTKLLTFGRKTPSLSFQQEKETVNGRRHIAPDWQRRAFGVDLYWTLNGRSDKTIVFGDASDKAIVLVTEKVESVVKTDTGLQKLEFIAEDGSPMDVDHEDVVMGDATNSRICRNLRFLHQPPIDLSISLFIERLLRTENLFNVGVLQIIDYPPTQFAMRLVFANRDPDRHCRCSRKGDARSDIFFALIFPSGVLHVRQASMLAVQSLHDFDVNCTKKLQQEGFARMMLALLTIGTCLEPAVRSMTGLHSVSHVCESWLCFSRCYFGKRETPRLLLDASEVKSPPEKRGRPSKVEPETLLKRLLMPPKYDYICNTMVEEGREKKLLSSAFARYPEPMTDTSEPQTDLIRVAETSLKTVLGTLNEADWWAMVFLPRGALFVPLRFKLSFSLTLACSSAITMNYGLIPVPGLFICSICRKVDMGVGCALCGEQREMYLENVLSHCLEKEPGVATICRCDGCRAVQEKLRELRYEIERREHVREADAMVVDDKDVSMESLDGMERDVIMEGMEVAAKQNSR
ncbi:hypothetical protein C8J56DRAFT_885615 [Mycena floridula]|nr:hypothetical protein C8J56DRAFT_885615 [Mycena floridula]